MFTRAHLVTKTFLPQQFGRYYIATVKMVETLYTMMEVHFKAKMTQVEPPKEDIFKKHKFARRSAQQYDEKTKLLTFKIFDMFNNAGKVKKELWNLLITELCDMSMIQSLNYLLDDIVRRPEHEICH